MIHNEIKVLKNLSHPNILSLVNAYKSDNHLYIITEFCESKGLVFDIFITFRRSIYIYLWEREALSILYDLSNGLSYLHSKGIMHRDIKPANILFSDNVPKLADFGFAAKINDLQKCYKIGTPLFMALEIFMGN